jgi:hypothetical protein
VQAVDVLGSRVLPSAARAGTMTPSTATPTAMPVWRNASFTPAANPLLRSEKRSGPSDRGRG